LRLFGNIIAGEIIVAVIYRLVKPIAPLSMVALGLVTGVLQAYVFMVLSTNAIAGAVRSDD
jgi:F-type H+-transporting ATPase subunit a